MTPRIPLQHFMSHTDYYIQRWLLRRLSGLAHHIFPAIHKASEFANVTCLEEAKSNDHPMGDLKQTSQLYIRATSTKIIPHIKKGVKRTPKT